MKVHTEEVFFEGEGELLRYIKEDKFALKEYILWYLTEKAREV